MDQHDRLPDDLVQALSGAQKADATNLTEQGMLARVRQRVLRQVAADSVSHHTAVGTSEGRWKTLLPGIERKVLHVEAGVMSYLLKFAPGAVLPAHRHPIDEECIVIEGTLRIGPIELGPGGYHRVRKDVLDADSTSDEGAIIFLRGAIPEAEQLV